jgi:DNA primase
LRIKNFDQVVEELQPHLADYLNEQGIDTSRHFKCLNPKHSDKTPSCHMLPGNVKAYCQGCSTLFSIFDAAHLLEKKPFNGHGFVTETLQYLCDKYKIHIELGELSEEKLQELNAYRAHRDAADYINQQEYTAIAQKEFARRKWSVNTLKETITGCVPSFKQFIDYLSNKGYEESFLREADLYRPDIFNENSIIFTTCDEYGHPVGFSARNLLFDKNNPDSGQKYINQRTTTIFQKSKLLYGFNLAKDHNEPTYIFEGQGDVLTAREHGILNCCAIGSTALTTDHILLLKEFNKFNIVICLDGDKAGQNKIEKLLDTKFAGHKDMRVSIVFIPGNKDPDDYIRDSGITAFKDLARWSAFEWRLDRFTSNSDSADVSQAMIPFIVNEPSYIIKEDMAKVLANFTGYSIKSILSEVDRLQNVQEERKATERKSIVERALKEVEQSPSDAEVILTEAKNKLFEISKKYDQDNMSEDAFLSEITEQRLIEENKSDTFAGFVFGPDLKIFQDKMDGQWNKDVLCIFGGRANSGKTSIMCKIAYDIAAHEENNAVVIYHTIDDTQEQLLPKLIAIAAGRDDSDATKNLTINQIKSPNYWSKELTYVKEKRSLGYSRIEKLAKDGRLVVKDNNHGSSIAYMETIIQYFQEKFPDRQIVYFLDNFHKLTDFSDQKEERVRFKKLSNIIKDIATRYHIPVLTTCEYNKVAFGSRPDNNSISETRALEYDANLIVHLYNELHEKGPNATMSHVAGDSKLPIIEMIFGKNKITSFKSSLYFKFFPASSDFKEIDESLLPASNTTKSKFPCSVCKQMTVEMIANENNIINKVCRNEKCPLNIKKEF